MQKPKILIAISGFLPGLKFGGTVTSRTALIEKLEKYFDFRIITLNHDYRATAPYSSILPGWNQYGNHKILYLSDKEHNQQTIENILKTEHPALIYASGTITSYFQYNRPILKAARRLHIPVVVAPDGDMRTQALRLKKLKKWVAIALCRLVGAFKSCYFQTTTPEETRNLQRLLGVRSHQIMQLPNMPHRYDTRRNYVKKAGGLKMVFAARIHPQKNLLFALQVVKRVQAAVQFDIYGPVEGTAYWKQCQRVIEMCPAHIRITYKGVLPSAQARHIYREYDFSFLPTLGENYGYTIEESLACGCPVLISRGTTPWDDVHQQAGFVFPLAVPEDFVHQIEKAAAWSNREYQQFVAAIYPYLERKCNYQELEQKYRNLFKRVSTKHGFTWA